MFANLKKRFLVIVLTVMMLGVPIAAFSTSLASASPTAGAGLIGNTGTLLSGAVSTFPYNQGFETGPSGALINEANWGSNQWTYKTNRHSGSLAAGAAITTTGDDTRRLFVNVNFSGKVCTSITYWYKITSADTTHRLMRLIGSTNSTNGQNNNWFVLKDWTDISYATSWTQFYADQNLFNFSYQSNCYIKIQVKNMSGHNQRTLYVDDFHIGVGLSYGPEYVFNSNPDGTGPSCIARLDSSRALIVYEDYTDGYGTAKVVTTDPGNNITYGSAYVFNYDATSIFSATALDSTRVLIAYNGQMKGIAVIATISGNSISFGPTCTFKNANIDYISATSLDSAHVFIAWKGAAIVATVTNGNTITVGQEKVFNSSGIGCVSATALSSSRAVIAYNVYQSGNTWYGFAIVATVSGNTISYGSQNAFSNVYNTDSISATALDSSRALIAYAYFQGGNTWPGAARVATVSGNTISYGSQTAFNSYGTACVRATALGSARILIAYRDSNVGTGILLNVSGNAIGIGPETVFNPGPATTYFIWATSLDFCHALISYHDDGNDSRGTAIVAAI
jgi:hypothetical protein